MKPTIADASTLPQPSQRFATVQTWAEVLRTGNLSAGRHMDAVTRWLLIARASVFTMTLTSAAIGGLLAAAEEESFHWVAFLLTALGLTLCHASNNMTNDYLDLESGVDTPDYARALYAPHPILSGLVSKAGLLAAIALVNLATLGIAVYLTYLRGWPVLVFTGLGFFLSLFYVAPPLRLKHRGLGELSVFVVWGPLMIGGAYYTTSGELTPWAILASIPYAVLVTTVLIGKHLDKAEQDQAKGIHTMVVLLGERASLALNRALMVGFYVVVLGLVLAGVLGVWVALVALSLARLRSVLSAYSRPRPERAPPGYPIWPLWFVAWAFLLTRRAGLLFLAGLILNLVLPLQVPWGP